MVNETVERRKYKTRVLVNSYVTVILTTDKNSQEEPFMSENISPGGIYLAGKKAYPVGTSLDLKVHTPTALKPLNIEARVARIAKDQDSEVVGMGLIITKISKSDKGELLKSLYLMHPKDTN